MVGKAPLVSISNIYIVDYFPTVTGFGIHILILHSLGFQHASRFFRIPCGGDAGPSERLVAGTQMALVLVEKGIVLMGQLDFLV